MYVRRVAEAALETMRRGFPVLAITGPRQSGKTTLARRVFPDHEYVSLEDPDVHRFAVEDPRRFLDRYRNDVVLDEVQRAPEILSYLQGLVDEDPAPARFVLTGSQQFGLLQQVTQSLAGRVGMVTLLPFSAAELQAANLCPRSVDELLHAGLYPPIHDRRLEPRDWLAAYVGTYVERDVRQIVNVRDLMTFRNFVRLCAGRTGQLLNLSSLGSDAGVTHATAKAWISVLEASFIVHRLLPHHANFGKRLIKTPKLYFMDPGLCAWLIGIERSEHVATHPLRGALFETFVVSELLKSRLHRGLFGDLFFWRDRAGLEVDVVVERDGRLDAIEIKAGATVPRDAFASLRRWAELAGDLAGHRYVVYGGERGESRSDGRVVPWHETSGYSRAPER